MRYLILLFAVILFASCSERDKPKVEPIGVWENTTHWDNNKITLTVREDSTMLFKVEKNFCPGTKFFVAVGDWHVENDSVLVMEPITDGRHYEIKDLFPELTQIGKDSNNVHALDVSARLIMADSCLYDLDANGKRFTEHAYRKVAK
jgi:hypothetical protein